MATEVQESSYEPKDPNKFYFGTLTEIVEFDGNWGRSKRWVIELDEDRDNPFINDNGEEEVRTTWMFTGVKLTLGKRNSFRKVVVQLTGEEPVPGTTFFEEHYTKTWWDNVGLPQGKDPEALTKLKQPWRVGVMFDVEKDGDDIKESVARIGPEERIKSSG